MNPFRVLLATGAVAFPLMVAAQTANTPGGSAATGSGLDQTKGSPAQSTPRRTPTSPDMTNPSGTLPAKDGAAAADVPSTSATTRSTGTKTKHGVARTNNDRQAGDVPTYPAPAPDGTPTK